MENKVTKAVLRKMLRNWINLVNVHCILLMNIWNGKGAKLSFKTYKNSVENFILNKLKQIMYGLPGKRKTSVRTHCQNSQYKPSPLSYSINVFLVFPLLIIHNYITYGRTQNGDNMLCNVVYSVNIRPLIMALIEDGKWKKGAQ